MGTYAAPGQSRKTTGPSEKTKKNPGPVEGHGGPWGRPSTFKYNVIPAPVNTDVRNVCDTVMLFVFEQ